MAVIYAQIVVLIVVVGLVVNIALAIRWIAGSRPTRCFRRMFQTSADSNLDKEQIAIREKMAWMMLEKRQQMMLGFVHTAMVWSCFVSPLVLAANAGFISDRYRSLFQDVLLSLAFVCLPVWRALLVWKPIGSTVNCVGVFFLAISLCYVLLSGSSREIAIINSVMCVIPRLASGLACMNLKIVSCSALVHSIVSCYYYYDRTESDSGIRVRHFVVVEVMMSVAIVVLTWGWQTVIETWTQHETETTASRNEIVASRRLLNTICDATMELDADLGIIEEASQLAGLLQHGCNRSLAGTKIEQLLIAEDREHFRRWISTPVPPDQAMASVFRVNMRDSLGNLLSMEVFHVPVYGSLHGASHLIGVREHSASVDTRATTHPNWALGSGRGGPRIPGGPPRTGVANPAESGRLHDTRNELAVARGGSEVERVQSEDSRTESEISDRRSVSSSQGSSRRARVNTLAEPLTLSFEISTMTILDSSGTFSELCPKGSSLKERLLPGQDFFIDLKMGTASLDEMHLSDPRASFTFRTSITFDHGHTYWKALGEVTLSRVDADAISELPALSGDLLVARVRITKGKMSPKRTLK